MPNIGLAEIVLVVAAIAATVLFWGAMAALVIRALRWVGVLGPKLTAEDVAAIRQLRADQRAQRQSKPA